MTMLLTTIDGASFPLDEGITAADLLEMLVSRSAPLADPSEAMVFMKSDGGALILPWGQIARIVEIMP
jgi:hypothetical protein